MITGYIPGTTLAAGTVQKLSCISTGGNPLATLTWFKNDKKVSKDQVNDMSHIKFEDVIYGHCGEMGLDLWAQIKNP